MNRVAELSPLERRAHQAWLAYAVDTRYGVCDTCGRMHDDDGRRILVARQNHSRRYSCLDCWDATA